nr:hypothetical protein [uncultured Bacillus sp.]
MKKAPILAVTMMLTLGSLTSIAHAYEIPSNERANEMTELRANEIKVSKDTSNSISEVAPYVHKDDKGFLYVDSNIPRDVYIKNQVDVLEASFEKINKQVADGQVVINDDLSITSTSSISTLSTKGYTSEKFW